MQPFTVWIRCEQYLRMVSEIKPGASQPKAIDIERKMFKREDTDLAINLSDGPDSVSICSVFTDITNRSLSRVGSFSEVNVSQSKDVHFGHKVFAAPITLVNNLDHDNDEDKTDGTCCDRLCHRIKNATWKEKAECIGAVVFVLCTSLILTIFIMVYLKDEREPDGDFPDPTDIDWYVNREQWGARNASGEIDSNEPFRPIKYVILGHTVSAACTVYTSCVAEMRHLQNGFMSQDIYYDIGYNFLIGGDGRAYEGRGWYQIGGHTLGHNNISIGVNYIGDYRLSSNTDLSEKQINATFMLLEKGLELGVLSEDYVIVCFCEIRGGSSPGGKVYNKVITWPRYEKVFHQNCSL